MVLSTAIPILIAAIVIVIISKGIESQPIKPKTKLIDSTFGKSAIIEINKDLNKIKNIINNKVITVPKVSICDLNKLCNILLYNTNTLPNLTLSLSIPICAGIFFFQIL